MIINVFVVSVFAAGFHKASGPQLDVGLQNAGVSDLPVVASCLGGG
jgi:hypothetical protein